MDCWMWWRAGAAVAQSSRAGCTKPFCPHLLLPTCHCPRATPRCSPGTGGAQSIPNHKYRARKMRTVTSGGAFNQKKEKEEEQESKTNGWAKRECTVKIDSLLTISLPLALALHFNLGPGLQREGLPTAKRLLLKQGFCRPFNMFGGVNQKPQWIEPASGCGRSTCRCISVLCDLTTGWFPGLYVLGGACRKAAWHRSLNLQRGQAERNIKQRTYYSLALTLSHNAINNKGKTLQSQVWEL